jgi:hypothetical protein
MVEENIFRRVVYKKFVFFVPRNKEQSILMCFRNTLKYFFKPIETFTNFILIFFAKKSFENKTNKIINIPDNILALLCHPLKENTLPNDPKTNPIIE